MTTWHQQQPIRRALAEAKASGRPFVHPLAHPTEYQVIEDQQGQMAAGCGRFKTLAEANAEVVKGAGRYVIHPSGAAA